MNDDIIVAAKDLTVAYDRNVVLHKVSLTVKRGQIVTIIGPNGSGKSTLARTILGLVTPLEGEVKLEKDVRIGYMPQKLVIDQVMPLTVERFLATANTTFVPGQIENIAAEIGITKILPRQIHDISGGEMQRVMLARSLINDPDFLVLDEPVQAIDVAGQLAFYELIAKIRDARKASILMISHDLYMVMKATDHVVCLNHHICCEGSPENISKNLEYIKLFGPGALNTIALYQHHHDHTHNAD